jgi:hypothetical protein
MQNLRLCSRIQFLVSKSQEKVMLLSGTEKEDLYISTRHKEKCSGFILITMSFHNFSRCNAKHIVKFTV